MQVESIVLSIISMLSSPNDESPANVEAAVSKLLNFSEFVSHILLYMVVDIYFYINAAKIYSLFHIIPSQTHEVLIFI